MNFTDMSDAAVDALLDAAYAESQRRAALRAAPAAIEEAERTYLEARDGDPDPEQPPAWINPGGAHGMSYPLGYRVTHDSKTYTSRVPRNQWEPGADNGHAWLMDTPTGPTVQPWTYPVAYAVGDEVTYQGRLYRCKLAHTSASNWQPPVAHGNWTDLGPA